MKQLHFLTSPSSDSILSVSTNEDGQFQLFAENNRDLINNSNDILKGVAEPNSTLQSTKLPVIYFGLDDIYIIKPIIDSPDTFQ